MARNRITLRDCHVAAAVNGQISTRAVLRDQRTDEALITAMDRTITEIARHADRCWRAYSRIGAPQWSPKKIVIQPYATAHNS